MSVDLKKRSSFLATGNKEAIEDFEKLFPFHNFHLMDMHAKVMEARSFEEGGNGFELKFDTLVSAMSKTTADYQKFETMIDELTVKDAHTRACL